MRDSSSRFSFEEGPRLSSLLSELMDQDVPAPAAKAQPAAPAAAAPPVAEPRPAPTTLVAARPLGEFLKSIPWSGPKVEPAKRRPVAGIPLREFWGLVNWGDTPVEGAAAATPTSLLDLGQPVDSQSVNNGDTPPTVENLMSQFVWD